MVENLLKALLMMGSISLIAGILLALVAHFLQVKENEKLKEIRAALPGVNCGACGFKGCDDYAAALAEGRAKPNLCVPGAEDAANAISKILGVEAEEINDVVAFVGCNGNCDATTKKADYDGISSCKAAALLYAGPNSCSFGCLGLGDCVKACPAGALSIVNGIAKVDTSKCIGCALCTKTCPKHIISMVPQETKTVVMCSSKDKGADAKKNCKNACIGCKKCEMKCPSKAITVTDNIAKIDYSKCTGCGICVEGCPTGALHTVFFPDIPPKNEESDS